MKQSSAIQGKDCLVQKFRNSSVMLEAPHYRPKVLLTRLISAAVLGDKKLTLCSCISLVMGLDPI